MSRTSMTSLQRIQTTLGHQEPDRVPLLLLFTIYGARELQVPIQEYCSRADYIVEGQYRLVEKFRSDCLFNFCYAATEIEAWGGSTIFREDGPPNAGPPIITDVAQIRSLQPPRIAEATGLQRVLEVTRGLAERNRGERLLIGVVIAPFSLPVLQLGFERYLNLMFEQPELLEQLLRVNEHFCIEWANAQIEAGAGAICFFNPLASTTMVAPDYYQRVGHPSTLRCLAQIKGATAIHLAAGRCMPIIDLLASTSASVLGVSAEEDLAVLKRLAAGRIALVGNLNGIEMRRWTPAEVEAQVKRAIAAAAPGGGFVLSDNHGEIPFQVPEEVLHNLADAVERWGTYPLEWLRDEP
ncbi:uroporphyrinogen decarboxylase family protein [Candidatus Viridilinea mediisalina]|uniref:Methylcobamide--CoM methyltransferase MtbA n=1 Tax=Candidatus Viridilinea mediisalina TaxID=2024553 RepID=A0A2A6RL99_9CHLR|nr:uroporphyrinogen decarboxylase family protein [Candidatus Viridilinea mediisalina]PDW03822.1 methylcobamide--CoM methyltransferase MtbA [Candidatus Viridilinea mediisalina]